jgi:hypothetical protein
MSIFRRKPKTEAEKRIEEKLNILGNYEIYKISPDWYADTLKEVIAINESIIDNCVTEEVKKYKGEIETNIRSGIENLGYDVIIKDVSDGEIKVSPKLLKIYGCDSKKEYNCYINSILKLTVAQDPGLDLFNIRLSKRNLVALGYTKEVKEAEKQKKDEVKDANIHLKFEVKAKPEAIDLSEKKKEISTLVK